MKWGELGLGGHASTQDLERDTLDAHENRVDSAIMYSALIASHMTETD